MPRGGHDLCLSWKPLKNTCPALSLLVSYFHTSANQLIRKDTRPGGWIHSEISTILSKIVPDAEDYSCSINWLRKHCGQKFTMNSIIVLGGFLLQCKFNIYFANQY